MADQHGWIKPWMKAEPWPAVHARVNPSPGGCEQHPLEQELNPDCRQKQQLHSEKAPDVFPKKNASGPVNRTLYKPISTSDGRDQPHPETFRNGSNVLS